MEKEVCPSGACRPDWKSPSASAMVEEDIFTQNQLVFSKPTRNDRFGFYKVLVVVASVHPTCVNSLSVDSNVGC